MYTIKKLSAITGIFALAFFTSCSDNSSSADSLESITDTRDNQNYTITTIGNQIWMAENLNYETENSYCYDNNPDKCKEYGRLYTWKAALTACPEGWHLPTKEEFEILINSVGGKSTAGLMLKSTKGWFKSSSGQGNGNGNYDFSALPGGTRGTGIGYDYETYYAYFWSATDSDENNAYGLLLYFEDDAASFDSFNNRGGQSVRCVKD